MVTLGNLSMVWDIVEIYSKNSTGDKYEISIWEKSKSLNSLLCRRNYWDIKEICIGDLSIDRETFSFLERLFKEIFSKQFNSFPNLRHDVTSQAKLVSLFCVWNELDILPWVMFAHDMLTEGDPPPLLRGGDHLTATWTINSLFP